MHQNSHRIRVIIAGGGYAGLAALISLRQHCPNAEILLIDPMTCHLHRTHLHECFRRSAASLRVPFASIGKRFRFEHVQAKIEFNAGTLQHWQNKGRVVIDGCTYDFDYLVIATGTRSIKPKGLDGCYFLEDLIEADAGQLLRNISKHSTAEERTINIVGAGATGIQFLFELNEKVKAWRHNTGYTCSLRLINPHEIVLPEFPPGFNRYVAMRMRREGIGHAKNTKLVSLAGDEMKLQDCKTGREFRKHSLLTLAFIGQQPSPNRVEANVYGQVTIEGEVLDRIFTAGDCSNYAGYGANTMSAQVAVRKGKKVATNILIHSSSLRSLERYHYQELGYFVSLGSLDGVGWLGFKANVVAALPAFAIKEAIEAQFDLLLAGLDTYLL